MIPVVSVLVLRSSSGRAARISVVHCYDNNSDAVKSAEDLVFLVADKMLVGTGREMMEY